MEKRLFNWDEYMATLVQKNKLCQQLKFEKTSCSGISYLEGMLSKFRTTSNFVCTCDISNCRSYYNGSGWLMNRTFMCFILARFDPREPGDQQEKMEITRKLYKQLLSRMIQDADNPAYNEIFWLNVQDVKLNEIGGSFLNSCTGLYFQISKLEPMEVAYNKDEWM